jgi:hypothetical protein
LIKQGYGIILIVAVPLRRLHDNFDPIIRIGPRNIHVSSQTHHDRLFDVFLCSITKTKIWQTNLGWGISYQHEARLGIVFCKQFPESQLLSFSTLDLEVIYEFCLVFIRTLP